MDYVLSFYGPAGTGLKHRFRVYFFDPQINKYIENDEFSSRSNLTFYLDEEKITWFDMPMSEGIGERLEWIDQKWQATKRVVALGHTKGKVLWKINYPLTNKQDSVVRSRNLSPPQDILEHQYIH